MKALVGPAALAIEAARDIIEETCEAIGVDAINWSVEDIENEHVSGFIPFTDGGLNGCVTFPFYCEASYATEIIERFVASDNDECVASFRAKYELSDDAEVGAHPDWEEWLTTWEQEDDCCWFVYARAIYRAPGHRFSESGEAEIEFCLGINTDFNYGRDNVSYAPAAKTHWVWERNVPIAQLDESTIQDIKDAMIYAWCMS